MSDPKMTSQDFQTLAKDSGLFDPDWYLSHNADVRKSGRDPWAHFISDGAFERRDPGPNFDTSYYVEQCSTAELSGMSPFEHYIRIGRSAGYNPRRPEGPSEAELRFAADVSASGLFDADWYLAHNKDVASSGRDPMDHFLNNGAKEHRDPGPGFSTSVYVGRNLRVDFTNITPFEHYLQYADKSGKSAKYSEAEEQLHMLVEESGLFEAAWYLSNNPDIARSSIDPMEHLIRFGAAEGRDPGPNFEAAFYVDQNPDVATSGLSPLEHYLRIGRQSGRSLGSSSSYEAWVTRFDEITQSDEDYIRADSIAQPPRTVVCLHVMTAASTDLDEIRSALSNQIGVVADVRVIARSEGYTDPEQALDDLPDDAVIILSGATARLRSHAAYTFANVLIRDRARAAYSDHDHLDTSGRRDRPVFKPAMSPDFMSLEPYAGPVIALQLQGMREFIAETVLTATSDNWNASLARLLSKAGVSEVKRVPLPLYSLTQPDDLRAGVSNLKTYEPVRSVVTAADTDLPPRLASFPTVCIIIPTRNRWELLKDCVDSILADTEYPSTCYELLILDNSSDEEESISYLQSLDSVANCSVVSAPGPFNFAKICNLGAKRSDVDVLVFLNNDMTVISPDWLTTLVAHSVRPEIGIVGAQLLYPDNTVQHGGVLLGFRGVAGHRLHGTMLDDARKLDVTRELTAVTGACIAIRRKVFEEVEGFDEALKVAFNDIVLCARVFKAGYRNLYVARPLLYHHESKSRGYDDTREAFARNTREAIYARQHFGKLFQNDPSYNPNLSLQKPGALAVSPRVTRPWRRPGRSRSILILSVGHQIGYGVGCVIAIQAQEFLRRGWTVTIGGPVRETDRLYPGCDRVKLESPVESATYAVAHGFDCILAHTPPFFSVTRYLGQRPLFYAYDHGEPPPHLFRDREARENVDWEKRFCAPLARRIFCISEAIQAQQYEANALVLRNGNSHFDTWSEHWAGRRSDLRRKFGFGNSFVVLNVCRFHENERRYKGVEAYINLANEYPFLGSKHDAETIFVLAGRGDDHDVAFVKKSGLVVFPNITDQEMAELYAASDLYVSLSQWEGYNLGIGQALAMGLNVVASDIPAHREFNIRVSNSIPDLCKLVRTKAARRQEDARLRAARVEPWKQPISRMIDLLEADLAVEAAETWLCS